MLDALIRFSLRHRPLILGVAVLLMVFVLFVGPTAQLFRDFVQNLGLYLDTLDACRHAWLAPLDW